METINLMKYSDNGLKVFSGREYGKRIRKKLNLDKIDVSDEKLKIQIDNEVYSINPSFFLGAWGESVRRLGEARFKEKYIFECNDIIMENIERGIKRAVQSTSIID